MKLHPFSLEEFAQIKVEGEANLINPIDQKVVASVRNDQESLSSTSETDSFSRELNEAMDVRALISSGCNKHKAIVGLCALTLSVRGKEIVHNWSATARGGWIMLLSPLKFLYHPSCGELATYFPSCSPIEVSEDTPPPIPRSSPIIPVVEEASARHLDA